MFDIASGFFFLLLCNIMLFIFIYTICVRLKDDVLKVSVHLKLHVLFTTFYLLQSSYVILDRISFGVAYSITRFNVTREGLNSKVYHLRTAARY